MRRLAVALTGFALSAGFYLLLIDTTNVVEVYVLAGVAILAAAMFVVSPETGFTEATIRTRWLLGSWRSAASAWVAPANRQAPRQGTIAPAKTIATISDAFTRASARRPGSPRCRPHESSGSQSQHVELLASALTAKLVTLHQSGEHEPAEQR
jgi:hypothetical protein